MEKCGICHLTVAPQDPERKVEVGKVYHQSCVVRNIKARIQDEIKQEQERQVVWSGNGQLTRSVN